MKILTGCCFLMVLITANNGFGCEEGEQRISITGKIFTCDKSIPKLEEAFRDPDGIIWGSVVLTNSRNGKVKDLVWTPVERKAEYYCESISESARLPDTTDFDRLATYLGANSKKGYSALTIDGLLQVLPRLADYQTGPIWSGDKAWPWPKRAVLRFEDNGDNYVFEGRTGAVTRHSADLGGVSVRCVVGRTQHLWDVISHRFR